MTNTSVDAALTHTGSSECGWAWGEGEVTSGFPVVTTRVMLGEAL